MGPVGPMLFLFNLTSQLVSPNLLAQGSVIDGRCDNLFDGWRLAMSSLDKMLGWFPHTATEWTELMVVAVLLWLLMMMAISELELTSVS